jgi:SAM-dependent methyltransferase
MMSWLRRMFPAEVAVASSEPLAYAVREALERGRETLCWARFSTGGEAAQSSQHLLELSGHGSEMDAGALELASGRVLDVGAGAGRHALLLQQRGLEVCALESAPSFCTLMRERGVRSVLEADFTTLREGRWDTVLLLHGGIGMAGTLARLPAFLAHCRERLADGGQLLLEWQDPHAAQQALASAFGRELQTDGRPPEALNAHEKQVQLTYRHWVGAPFDWVWPDVEHVARSAYRARLTFEVVAEQDPGYVLARLQRR